MSSPRQTFPLSFRRPTWFIVLVTLVFVALTIRLGYWQLGRGQQKEAMAALLAQRDTVPAASWHGELGDTAWQRRFLLTGVWQPQGQIYLDNRVNQGRAGFHVLTPLALPDGRWFLVNRGWLPKQVGVPPAALVPGGPVTLTIRLVSPQQHYVELATAQTQGEVWQNLDWSRYQKQFRVPMVAALAYQLEGQDSLIRNWPTPDLGVEKHYGYAGQWFVFAALAVVLFIVLHWKRPTQ
ncbi:SURF1 family protein [Chitinimonas sp. PSY-7]|uniref:SURF1 family cytochrome oxidase biogenesis protein n=1 Tax=Chitinimonas sp. PSY-7 TaxID=3459088 RepID=UPI00404009FC